VDDGENDTTDDNINKTVSVIPNVKIEFQMFSSKYPKLVISRSRK